MMSTIAALPTRDVLQAAQAWSARTHTSLTSRALPFFAARALEKVIFPSPDDAGGGGGDGDGDRDGNGDADDEGGAGIDESAVEFDRDADVTPQLLWSLRGDLLRDHNRANEEGCAVCKVLLPLATSEPRPTPSGALAQAATLRSQLFNALIDSTTSENMQADATRIVRAHGWVLDTVTDDPSAGAVTTTCLVCRRSAARNN